MFAAPAEDPEYMAAHNVPCEGIWHPPWPPQAPVSHTEHVHKQNIHIHKNCLSIFKKEYKLKTHSNKLEKQLGQMSPTLTSGLHEHPHGQRRLSAHTDVSKPNTYVCAHIWKNKQFKPRIRRKEIIQIKVEINEMKTKNRQSSRWMK